jgi:hypothetical protein
MATKKNGTNSVVNQPLVNPQKVYRSHLLNKLEWIKKVIIGMNSNDDGFSFIKNKPQWVSDAKIKESIFIVSQIRQLMSDSLFDATQKEQETPA